MPRPIPKVSRIIPSVKGGRLYRSQSRADPIVVGSGAWYDWLEHHRVFRFVAAGGTFTARKKATAASELDWEACRRQAGTCSRLWLGVSATLTLEGLQAAAQTLAQAPGQPSNLPQSEADASRLPTPATAAQVDPLLHTKLYPPRLSRDVIPRARLIERLNAGLSGPVTLICAPAGFGKTTVLAEWMHRITRPSAWLSLDERDNELRAFMQALIAALQAVFPEALQATASLLQATRFPSAGEVASLLLSELADVPEDLVLVLDDYHLIHTGQVHTLLEGLIEQLPTHLHLVMTTRAEPPLPLARWRAKGYLTDLGVPDLRFTLQETQAFLTRMLGSVVAPETVMELEERTEGWIAVVRLAALSLRTSSDPAAFLERLRHCPDHNISRYLLEEVLDHLTSAVQELLVRASLLEQFGAPLCAVLLGSDVSHEQVQSTLDGLERSNLFVVPLDERRGWYRLHHLFQPLLEQRLREHLSPEEVATLHRRASTWFAEQGLIEEAIQHTLAAGDASGAAQLVGAQLLWTFEQQQFVRLERWLRLLPEEQVQGSPFLLLARVWILQAHGQLKDFPRLLTTAEHLLATGGSGASDLDDPKHSLLRALIALARSQFQYFSAQAQASLQSARSALEWLPAGQEHVASNALQFLAWSYQAIGQETVALVELQRALRDLSTRPTSTARLLFAQAVMYLAAGKLPQVEHTARHLLRLAQEANLALSQYWAHWLLGVVYYERNQVEMAVYHGSAVIANRYHAHFWAVRDAMCGLALAYQAQGLGTQAQETAHALLDWVQEQHNIGELLTAYAFCGQLALLQGEVEEAQPWLEMAGEQEVLGSMTFLEDPPLTKAWMLLAKGDEVSLAGGQALLTHLLQHVQAIHSTRKTIQVLALQAWAYDLQGRETEALEVLEHALALGRPGGFIRTFADVAPLAKLLQEVRKHRKAQQTLDSQLEAYLHRILEAMRPMGSPAVSTQLLLRQEGLDPLTNRELQILPLLDKDLTNKEIARELVLAPGTVKVHTSNLYRKLGVDNRRAAVTLAKALGLLVAA